MKHWSFKWLSRAGQLVLIKSVVLAILVYWASLIWVPECILLKINKICSRFLWASQKKDHISSWVAWIKLSDQKDGVDWGLRTYFLSLSH